MTRVTVFGIAAFLTAIAPLSASARDFHINQQLSRSVFLSERSSLNPQPLPPKWATSSLSSRLSLNPQPLPPKQ